MKRFNKFLLFVFTSTLMTSCLVDDDTQIDDYDQSPNLVGFVDDGVTANITADGEPAEYLVTTTVVGPSMQEISEDVTFNIEVDPSSTAIEGVNYELSTTSVTLSSDENLISNIPITILTEGFEPPLEENPELILNITNVSGGNGVLVNGRLNQVTIEINYLCFSDLAGDYFIQYADGSTEPLVITESGPGEYVIDNLFIVSPAGYDWYFSDTCGNLQVTGFELDGYDLLGTGTVNPDGSLSFQGVELVDITGSNNFTIFPEQ